jgi:hypothetical protein
MPNYSNRSILVNSYYCDIHPVGIDPHRDNDPAARTTHCPTRDELSRCRVMRRFVLSSQVKPWRRAPMSTIGRLDRQEVNGGYESNAEAEFAADGSIGLQ